MRDLLRRLDRAELPVETTALARFLVGKLIVRRRDAAVLMGRIVETEAYLADDPACHAFRGRTLRTGALFLERGHAYVYLAYGVSWMLNVSGGPEGVGAGVLIRALEPIEGISAMQRARGTTHLRDLCRGPGRLAAALGIGPEVNGVDLCDDPDLWLADDGEPASDLGESPRIGITRAADLVLRFYVRGSPFVSGAKSMRR